MQLNALFVDFNCYFAACEQQLDARLRGRPIVVAAVDAESTCCIAASQEAKRLGIRTGTPVGEARRMCRGIRVLVARPREYIRFHHRILAAIDTCVPVHSVHSIDEMLCRLAPAEQPRDAAVALAGRIKVAVREQVGECLTCSIGIAPNRLLAKLATDLQKPDGLIVLDRSNLPDALFRCELDDLPGIGKRMLARLNRAGVMSVESLYAQSESRLREIWGGVVGRRWWYWLRGHDLPESVRTHRSSVGCSHVLPPPLRDLVGARGGLVRLIHRAAARLRRTGYWAQHMSVYVSFTYREEGWSGSVAVGLCQDTPTLIEAFEAVWRTLPPHLGRPTQVAITLFNLIAHASAEVPMFDLDHRRLSLSRLLDEVNDRYGLSALYLGGMHGYAETAPARIAFGQIPNLAEP